LPEGENLLTSLPDQDERLENISNDRVYQIAYSGDGDQMVEKEETIHVNESQPIELTQAVEDSDEDAAFDSHQAKRPKLK
jgi:hypothetical protein